MSYHNLREMTAASTKSGVVVGPAELQWAKLLRR